jgi:glycosyltransferase involved in cell wall biosynthesis
VEYLVRAFAELAKKHPDYRLVIAGNPREPVQYWADLAREIDRLPVRDRIVQRIEYVPDEQTEIFFKAADILILPYTHIFQSGVLFLGYSFGLPVIVADVGSMKDEVIEGKTGFVFKPQDCADLARTIERYFSAELYHRLETNRQAIRDYANERYSWSKVGQITEQVYTRLLEPGYARVSEALSQ